MMQRSCIAVSKVHVNVVVEVASFLHSYLAQIIKDMNISIPPSSSRKKFIATITKCDSIPDVAP